MKNKTVLVIFSFLLLFGSIAEARVGGGRSFGNRGSRGFAPRNFSGRPIQSPSTPARDFNNANTAQRPSAFGQTSGMASGGFLRSMAGGLAGGLIGSMIFRSLGLGGGMGMPGTGGIGLLEILLFGGLAFLLFRMFLSRKLATANGTQSFSSAATYEASPTQTSSLDSAEKFNSSIYKEAFSDLFFQIQAAWTNRDLLAAKNHFTSEMYSILDGELSVLKQKGQINRLENIAVRSVEALETWEENGEELVTVRFQANLLDYTVDEKTGAVVDGNKSSPVKFVEFWTFSRSAKNSFGPSGWQLSAIEQE